ncbi:hypothetical protein C0R05_32160 [Streptomyces albidoflavus]|nr:hypothetical protein C0R05_32160 [Streptomyces albidoflavus]
MTTSEADKNLRIQRLLRMPCGCTGQCGTPHARSKCDHRPSHLRRHCAAPPDPSAPFDAAGALLSWCSTCYGQARKRGLEARQREADEYLLAIQEELF